MQNSLSKFKLWSKFRLVGKGYHKYLYFIIFLTIAAAVSQTVRYQSQNSLSECIRGLASLADQKETMQFEIWNNQIATLHNELSEMTLMLAETRARLRLSTDRMIEGLPRDVNLPERIKELQPLIGTDLKSTAGLEKVRFEMEQHARAINILKWRVARRCDRADSLSGWLGYLEGLLILIIGAVAFYAGRKSLA